MADQDHRNREVGNSNHAQQMAASGMKLSMAIQDLSHDELVGGLPRTDFAGLRVPILGGIPLLAKIGQGGMGSVYLGVRVLLQQEVAVKILPLHSGQNRAQAVERFLREARLAARVESPHLVRVSDVNEEAHLFYLVMEYVHGISAGKLVKMAVEHRKGLAESVALVVCTAATTGLAAAHARGIIHRDIKPDNILIPVGQDDARQFSAAKLVDLGLAHDQVVDQGLTVSEVTMGTAGFMAPEQARSARTAGKPADVFSMGATLYALLVGHSPFRGDSLTDVIIRTIQQPHEPIRSLRPDVSTATAKLLDRCLEKKPEQRYPDALALLAALQACRPGLPAATEPRQAATVVVRPAAPGKDWLEPVSETAEAPKRRGFGRRRLKLLLGLVGLLLLATLGVWTGSKFLAGRPKTVFGIACGTEKSEWFQWAIHEFAGTSEGGNVRIELFPIGSQEGIKAFMNGDSRLHVWSPASGLYVEHFAKAWREKYGNTPLWKSEVLTLSPMVFVTWQDRYELLVRKYNSIDFISLQQALTEKDGWNTIARKPEWGRLLYAHANPAQYNSGLMTLILMAYQYHRKDKDLRLDDVNDEGFRKWIKDFENASTTPTENSESIVKDMVITGPSLYEVVCTYEDLAIRYLRNAESRWQPIHIDYPALNKWNDNPYIIVNAPWSTIEQRDCAQKFLTFLLSEPAQTQALRFGFRPANPDVPMRFSGSPFEVYAQYGLKLEMPVNCETPKKEVVDTLVEIWVKNRVQDRGTLEQVQDTTQKAAPAP